MAPVMGDCHRRYLQVMMSSGIIDGVQAKTLHRHCCEVAGANYREDKLDEFIEVINANLQPMFMNIRKGMSEEDGQPYYALVNLAETEVTRMSSDCADNELELFKKILDLVVESDCGTASSTDILNCGDTLLTKKLKKKEVEQVLHKFVQNKWLTEKRGEYALSTRCIMEMEQYIRTLYQDLIKNCHVCHNIAFQCQTCENLDCGIRMHFPCVARYFKGRSDPHCPNCNQFWPHEIPEIHRPSSSQNQPSSSKENTAPNSRASTSQGRRSSRK